MPDDFSADITTTGSLNLESPSTGVLETVGDVDWFEIQLEAWVTYVIDLTGPSTTNYNNYNPYLFLGGFFGATGQYQYEWYNTISAVRETIFVIESGTYYVAATGDGAQYPTDPNANYTITMEALADDFFANIYTVGVLTLDTPVTGIFELSNDSDWFKLELEAGVLYQVDLEGLSTGKGTTADPVLNGLFNSNGSNYYDQNYGYQGLDTYSGEGNNSRASLSVVQSGTYYISAAPVYHGQSGQSSPNDTYTISLTTIGDDFGNTPTTAGVLEIGTAVQATIDYDYTTAARGDRDWFEVALESDVIYQFSATNPDSLAAPIQQLPIVGLFNAQSGSMLPYRLTATNSIYAAVQVDGSAFIEAWSAYYENNLGDYLIGGEEVYRRTAAETQALGPEAHVNVVYGDSYYHTNKAGATNDVIFGTQRNDISRGLAGADTIVGGEGNDLLIGDDALSDDYSIDSSTEVYRAYELIFGRAPDAAGHKGFVAWDAWIVSKTLSMINSAEFDLRFGDLTNEEFVDLLYTHLRGPDGAGDDPARDIMISRLGDADAYSYSARAEIATRFVNSDEAKNLFNEAATAFTLRNNQADASDEVFSMYHALLDRDPEKTGFTSWVSSMADGLDLSGLAQKFIGSQEFALNGSLTDRGFARIVLDGLSDTTPTEQELDRAVSLLTGGVGRADFAAAMVTLADDAGLVDWMRDQGGNDVLIGGAGNNTLYGGTMSDKFVFNVGDGGVQKIKDFEAWDVIKLDGFGYSTQADALSQFEQVGANAVFADQGTTIVLTGFNAASLTDEMFLI